LDIENKEYLNVTVSGNTAVYNDNNGTWNINKTNVYASSAHGIYADNSAEINIGDNSNILTTGNQFYGVYANDASNITLGSNATVSSSVYAIYAADNSNVFNSGGILNITGNIYSSDNSHTELTFADNSIFKGAAATDNNGIIDLSFNGLNSLWELSGNSNLTNLYLANGAKIDLTRGGVFFASAAPTTLFVDNLHGEGVFDVRFDLRNEINDIIKVSNASSGNYGVSFHDKTNGAYTLDHNISLLVVDQSNPLGNYTASYTGKIDLGGYEYNLTKSAADDNWYVNLHNNTTTSGGSGGGGSGSGGTLPPCSSAHCAVKSFLGINYLTNYMDSQTLLQRVGELRDGRHDREDVWARTYFGQLDSFKDDTRINKVTYYGVQGGADRANEYEYATTYLGWAFGYSKSDIDYLKGSGRSENFYGGVYASVLFKSDVYMDFITKYNYNKDEFDTVTSNGFAVNGGGSTKGFSFDAEVGRRYDMSKFYAEPQVGISYARQNEADVYSSDGMRIVLGGYESYKVKGGLLLGYKIKDMINVYLKEVYIKELNYDASYTLNGNKIKYKLNESMIDSALGLTISTDIHHLYLEGNYQIGDEFDNKKVNLGYRYDF
jgi:outer membrane autotransporter protein